MRLASSLAIAAAGLIGAAAPAIFVQAAEPATLTIFAAGTLAVPFKQATALYEKQNPDVTVQAQFGGSVKMAKQITDLHQDADILAVADYNVIPKYMFGTPPHAAWYAGFARNAITFVYTDKSKFANEINADNWYKVLARPGVEIGRSNPDTDPSGYQTVQMLNLAEKYYKAPGLEDSVLKNAPLANMRDTETSLIAALQLGQIDYLAIYRSDALQHHLKFIDLPAQIDLSDPADAAAYKQGVAHTKNGDLARHADRLCRDHGRRRQAGGCRGEICRAAVGAAGAGDHEGQRFRHVQPGLCGARRGDAGGFAQTGPAVAWLVTAAAAPGARGERAAPSRPLGLYLLCWFLGSLLTAFLVIPLLALTLSQSWASFSAVARMADVRDAIVLSLEGAFLSATLAAAAGVPLAYGLARTSFPAKARSRR